MKADGEVVIEVLIWTPKWEYGIMMDNFRETANISVSKGRFSTSGNTYKQ